MKTIAQITAFLLIAACHTLYSATPPEVGSAAPNFELKTLDGDRVELKEILRKKPVVLVVLRGWPGYQCPICTRQVRDFVEHADQFRASQIQVVMVYPGPNENFKAHAQEFLQDSNWPKEFLFVIDPGHTFVEQYGANTRTPTSRARARLADAVGHFRGSGVLKEESRASCAGHGPTEMRGAKAEPFSP